MKAGLHIVTWNVFHLLDGRRPPGPDIGSVLLRLPRFADGHVHLNRKYPDEMGRLLADAAADVAMLQEVPPISIARIARSAGMRAGAAVLTGPRLGPVWLRGRLGAANPDLWRTQEGNANVVLVGPGVRVVPGSAHTIPLNPRRQALRAAARNRLGAREVARWVAEPRRAVAVTVSTVHGRPFTVVSAHLHGARTEWQSLFEFRRLAAWIDDHPLPVVLGGDMNAPPDHPGFSVLAESGLDVGCDRSLGIDRVLVRGLEATPEWRLPPGVRTKTIRRGTEHYRLLLSDHDPVVRSVRPPA